jgi:pimeloyl-ACP methyl ester carboxylesterase
MKKWIKRTVVSLGILLLLVGLGVGWLGYQFTARVPGKVLDSNGFPIHYTDEGSGEAVVLIHGMGANSDINWRRAGITDLLAKDFRVVSLDIRGHGLSGKSHEPKDYGIEMVNDVARLLDHLKIEKAHVAGYSLGGFIALKFVAEHPDRVISVAYCASGWKDPTGPEDILSPYRKPETQAAHLHNGVRYLPAYADTGRFTEGPIDWIKDFVGDSIVDRKSVRAMKKGFRELIVSKEELAAMKTPSICFIGTNDGLKPYADDLHKVQPAVELVVLDGANHITTAMRGDFKSGLRTFFEKHRLEPAKDAN